MTTKPQSSALLSWVKTSDSLPGIADEQCGVLMWSPGWATWLKGMITRWADGSAEWSIYDQQNDRYYECEYPPEYWLCPYEPNAEITHPDLP